MSTIDRGMNPQRVMPVGLEQSPEIGPPTAPLPILDLDLLANTGGANERDGSLWRHRVAAAASVVAVGLCATGGVLAHENSVMAGVAVATGANQNPEVGQPPQGETGQPSQPEDGILQAGICSIPFTELKPWLLDPAISDGYECSAIPVEKSLFPVSTIGAVTTGSWTHPRHPNALLRRFDVQIVDDRSRSGASLFDNLGKDYPDSVVYGVKAGIGPTEYPARFIPNLGDKPRASDKLDNISGTIVKIPNPNGDGTSLAYTFAIEWGAGFGGDNLSVAELSRKLANSVLGNLVARN